MPICWSAGCRSASWAGARAGRVSASLLAALVFMFGGPASGRLQHTGIILIYALFPLALLLLLLALQKRSLLSAIGFCGGGVAAGARARPCGVAAVLRAGRGAGGGGGGRADHRLGYLRQRATVMFGLGLCRRGVAGSAAAVDDAVRGAVQPAGGDDPILRSRDRCIRPISPLAGGPPTCSARSPARRTTGGRTTTRCPRSDLPTVPSTTCSSASRPPSCCSGSAWAGGLLTRRDNRLMAGVLLVAVLYTMGRYSPLYSLAFNYVPGIDLFRRPIDGSFRAGGSPCGPAGRPAARHLRPRRGAAGAHCGDSQRWRRRGLGVIGLGGGVLRKIAPRTGVSVERWPRSPRSHCW